MRPTFLSIVISFLGTLCVLLLGTFALAQSSSAAEEKLRAELLSALSAGHIREVADLRPFYRRPSSVPVRLQTGVDHERAKALGQMLFFDPRLSTSGTISCATCHDPKRFWVDGLRQSIEGNSRRSMTLYNLAWDSCFTWHCEAGTLMSQSILAMTAPKGMAAVMTSTAPALSQIKGYQARFRAAFPKEKDPVSPRSIASAIEYYVASLLSTEAPFDRWVEGDETALSPAAKRGFLLFHTKANCAQCHNLWRFSDSRRYDIGIENITPDRQPLYKSVGLRNIADRPPYMHDGSLSSLPEVLSFYVRGGDARRPTKSPLIRPLSLSLQDQSDIILFLQSLSGPLPSDSPPSLP